MKRIVLFMHISLDGFVAGPGGEMNWIKVDEDLFDYAGKQTDRSDTALYGRVTYEMMESYWPTAGDMPSASKHDKQHSAWYNQVDKIVLSRSLKGAQLPNTTIISDNITEEVRNRKQKGGKDIVIFGSPTAAHLLMSENLVDDYWLFVNPVLLGKGIPLFKDIMNAVKLELITSHAFSSGVVCLNYRLKSGT